MRIVYEIPANGDNNSLPRTVAREVFSAEVAEDNKSVVFHCCNGDTTEKVAFKLAPISEQHIPPKTYPNCITTVGTYQNSNNAQPLTEAAAKVFDCLLASAIVKDVSVVTAFDLGVLKGEIIT